MGKIKVFTRQHKNVWKALEETGRYIAKREYISMDMQEHADIIFEVYDWLVRNGPDAANRPQDVRYPVWVSFDGDAAMMAGDDGVILELLIDEERITSINIAKWGTILNYSYIAKDEEDARRHRELCRLYGTDDVKAVMTQFYPEIRREIVDSWKRLFDDSVMVGNELCYGTIWEIRKEWVTDVRFQGDLSVRDAGAESIGCD